MRKEIKVKETWNNPLKGNTRNLYYMMPLEEFDC